MSTEQIQHKIDHLIAAGIKLPSPPAIAVRILNAVQSEEPSLKEIANIIASDPALTAKMLRIANSGFYALKYEVTNIEKALMVLGVNILKNIALSFVISNEMRGESSQLFDFDYFWRRSVTAAVAAELMADLIDCRSDDTFVSALLADIGVLILNQAMPSDYVKVIEEKHLCGDATYLTESRLLGISHQEMGAGLLERWDLPRSIFMPIRYHHIPSEAPEEFCRAAEVLQMADRLSAIYHNPNCAENVRKLQDEISIKFKLSEKVILDLIDSVAKRSIDILAMFEIDAKNLKPYSQMLQEANEQLGQLNLSYEQLVMELKSAKEETDRLAAELREANSRLRELVFRDGLTGLYNHRYFQETLDRELDRSVRYETGFSLIIFDLDYFKQVNDNYGHPNGDLVLISVSRTAEKTIRANDILARYGGEEFAVILPETDEAGLKLLAERLRRGIEQTATRIDQKEVRITISVGGCSYLPQLGRIDKKQLIDLADQALYRSKKAGRNRTTILSLMAGTETGS